jgi:hypothetical protein
MAAGQAIQQSVSLPSMRKGELKKINSPFLMDISIIIEIASYP